MRVPEQTQHRPGGPRTGVDHGDPAERAVHRVRVDHVGGGEVPRPVEGARFLAGELREGDVVLVKASNGAGLWRLGDELAGTVAS